MKEIRAFISGFIFLPIISLYLLLAAHFLQGAYLVFNAGLNGILNLAGIIICMSFIIGLSAWRGYSLDQYLHFILHFK